LTTLGVAMKWASTMTWKGQHPEVVHLDREYIKGVKVPKAVMEEVNAHLKRSSILPKWDVTITPHIAK
jgi:Rhodopirellula transposase DDE domain